MNALSHRQSNLITEMLVEADLDCESWPADLLAAAQSHRERLLVALHMVHQFGGLDSASVSEILGVISAHRLRKPSNPRRDIGESCKRGQAERVASGKYRLLREGEQLIARVADKAGVNWFNDGSPELTSAAGQIKTLEVSHPRIRDYVEECDLCLSFGARRAAVVLAWSGAIMTIRLHIATIGFESFNDSAKACTHLGKVRRVKALDDFEDVTDRQLLGVARHMGVINKTSLGRLEAALDLRKACAHPNSSPPIDAAVSGMIQELIEFVFVPFGR